jgi:hypothetical protein
MMYLLLIMIKTIHFLGKLASFNCLGTLPFHNLTTLFITTLKNGVLHSPPPYFGIVLSAYTKHKSKIQNLFKKWVIFPHSILILPSSIFGTVVVPLEFQGLYNSIPKKFEFFCPIFAWARSESLPLSLPESDANQ